MSPARSRVGVSADAFVAVVRAYADRVHDDVRRLGCSAAEAAEVVETSALGLCERLRARPDQVGDLVGAWFRDARVYAERVASGAPVDVEGEGIVRRSDDDASSRSALARLGERDRVALLLRDAYDLPYVSTAVALGTTAADAATLVGKARLRFLALAGGAAPAVPEDHDSDLATTARLADGQLAPDAVPAAEKHAAKCPVCKAVLPAQREARRLLTGLSIVAMADADRDALIARATSVAQRLLPSADEVAAAVSWTPGDRLVPMTLVAGCLGGALVLGSFLGVVTGGGPGFARSGAPSFEPQTPTPTATPTPSATPSATTTPRPRDTGTPSATATQAPPPPTRPPGPTYTPKVGDERIALSDSTGPNGETVTVTGTSWFPGRTVRLTYQSALGPTGSAAEAVPDAQGRFTVTIVCLDPQSIPGPHQVVATNDAGQTARATYTAT